jgi:hypothetical protein
MAILNNMATHQKWVSNNKTAYLLEKISPPDFIMMNSFTDKGPHASFKSQRLLKS